MEIVRVESSDLPAIGRLHEYFWGERSDVAAMTQALNALSDDPDHVLLAARDSGGCIGTATGVICHGLYGGYDTYMVVEDMVVEPEYRRQGVASALLSALESIASERGCNQVILLTESVREDAVALYRANGFEARWTGFKKKLQRGVQTGLPDDAPSRSATL
ncbi:MAG: GNAT family N-acetyltransferase [Coriobacteriia bacterium]|nr:GNAT family N-acetyltransferase [Coriobacteriia bacterium]